MTGLKGRIPFVVLWIICIIAVDAAPFFYPKGADPNVPGSAFQLENLAVSIFKTFVKLPKMRRAISQVPTEVSIASGSL